MKTLLIFSFFIVGICGFAQEREVLQMPSELNLRNIEFPQVDLPEVINPYKPIECIRCVWFYCSIQLPREAIFQTKVLSRGFPANYELRTPNSNILRPRFLFAIYENPTSRFAWPYWQD